MHATIKHTSGASSRFVRWFVTCRGLQAVTVRALRALSLWRGSAEHPTCIIAAAAASATAGLRLPKTCRQNERKSADECAAMVEGVESRVTRPQHSTARASSAQSLQGCGGVCIPLRGGEAVPSDGLGSVRRNTFSVLEHVAQVELSECNPLRR